QHSIEMPRVGAFGIGDEHVRTAAAEPSATRAPADEGDVARIRRPGGFPGRPVVPGRQIELDDLSGVDIEPDERGQLAARVRRARRPGAIAGCGNPAAVRGPCEATDGGEREGPGRRQRGNVDESEAAPTGDKVDDGKLP